MSEQGRRTNMASEFFTLSALYRLGVEPLLTLGNKKGVDIYIPQAGSEMISVEVKAVAKRMDWMFGDAPFASSPRKWVVLLCYNAAFDDLAQAPDSWVIPSAVVAKMLRVAGNGKTRYLSAKDVRESLTAHHADAGWARLRAASV